MDLSETMASGIEVVGSVSWGTHLCLFYQTKEDLTDILVPFFKAGLENNEFCMWVTSDPLTVEDARAALSAAVPDLDTRFESHQMEIVPHTEWYLKGGYFDMERVFSDWIGKLDDALARGFEGLRATGNTAWPEENNWDDFVQYEEKLNSIIGDYRMMAICTYSLESCNAREVIDVCSNHQFSLIRQAGEWELIEASEQKKIGQALRESEKKYRLLVENLNEGIWMIDAEAVTTFANDKMAQMLGYTAEEMMGKSLYEFMDDRGKEFAEYNFERRRQGFKEQHDFEFTRKDGSRLYASLETSPLSDSEGNFIGAVAGVMDITERKRAEEALRKNEEHYRLLFESSRDALMTISPPSWMFTSCNSAALEIFGARDESEFTSFGPWDLSPDRQPDGRASKEKAKDMIDTALREGSFLFGWTHRPLGGEEFPATVLLTRMEIGGEIVVLATVRDVTASKVAEEALKERDARLSSISEAANDGIILVDSEGNINHWNPAAERIFGHSADEAIGESISMLASENYSGYVEVLKDFIKQGLRTLSREEPIETVLLRKSGQEFPAEISLSRFQIGNDWNAEVIVRDVTERKRAEDALRESEQKYSQMFENMRSGVATYEAVNDGADFALVDFNAAAERIEGVDRKDILGRPVTEVFPGVTALGFLEVFRRVWRTGKSEYHPGMRYSDEREGESWRESSIYKLPGGEVAAIYDDVTDRKRAEEQMARSREQLRALSTRLQEAREEERTRIAREIHDELGQALTGLKMDISSLRRKMPGGNHPELSSKFDSMLGLIDSNISLVRKISSDLRPGVLDELGLAAAVDWQAQDFRKRTEIECRFHNGVGEKRFVEACSSTVFRVFQEALTNIIRHSKATMVDVMLEEHDGVLVLEVNDNGKGISESEIESPESLGILGMKERAISVGGEFDIMGVLGKGTTLTLSVPSERPGGGWTNS